MHLRKILEALAKLEGISKKDIVWEEVDWFERKHGSHGHIGLNTYRSRRGRLESIDLECGKDEEDFCSGWWEGEPYSLVYHNPKVRGRGYKEVLKSQIIRRNNEE